MRFNVRRSKMLRRVIACIAAILLLVATPLPVLANSPPPPPWLRVQVANPPENAVFVDILIKIDDADSNFTPVNEHNLDLFGLSVQAEIVGLSVNGFMSFTFHYNDAAADIEILEQGSITFGRGDGRSVWQQYNDLRTIYSDMKIALLDYEGNVVAISEPFNITDKAWVWFDGLVRYNHQSGEVNVMRSFNLFVFIGFLFRIIIPIVILTIIIEAITGIFFFGRHRKKIGLIVIVNAITQAAMWTAYFILPLPYIVSIIILETIIYISEFITYRKSKVMADESTRKILIYTIIANTLSLLVGLAIFG